MSDSKPGYKYLVSYQLAVVIFDLTVEFCDLYISSLRQKEQMNQAGRSGKQNIAEGYLERSLKSYIKLLGVALASIGELLEDYEDFLRQRGLPQWNKEDPRVREMRAVRVVSEPNPHLPQFPHIPHDPTLAANLMITLCQRATYLLKRQIESLETKFVNEGGYTENLFKKRLSYRSNVPHRPHTPHFPQPSSSRGTISS